MHADGAYMGGFTERKEMEKGEGREETASDDRKRREKRDTEKDRGRRERSRQSFAFERDRVLPALHTGVTQRCRGSALCLVLKGWGRVCLDANSHCYTVLRQLCWIIGMRRSHCFILSHFVSSSGLS